MMDELNAVTWILSSLLEESIPAVWVGEKVMAEFCFGGPYLIGWHWDLDNNEVEVIWLNDDYSSTLSAPKPKFKSCIGDSCLT